MPSGREHAPPFGCMTAEYDATTPYDFRIATTCLQPPVGMLRIVVFHAPPLKIRNRRICRE
jgi:hypothetical protein